VSEHASTSAAFTLAAFAAPAKGMMTQKRRTPANATGTVSASNRDRFQRGQKTGAIISVDTTTAIAPAADETPRATSLIRRNTIMTAASKPPVRFAARERVFSAATARKTERRQ
jgi:hypothetical protein